MYTVKQEKALTKLDENGDIQVSYLMHLTVDKISEIPDAKANWLAGSRCDVLEDNGHVYELSNSREWVEVNFFEQVGGSDGTDLSEYYTKSQTDAMIENNITELQSELDFAMNTGAKNYLKPDSGLPTSMNGVTITYQADGGICFNGTAEDDVTLVIFNGSKHTDWAEQHLHQKLILSGCPAGGGVSTYRIQFWKYDINKASAYDEGDGVAFTFTNDGSISANNNMWRVVILISTGQVCENLTFYPMIRDAGITDNSYQPYAMTNAELTAAVLTLLQNTGISAVSAEINKEKE